MSNWIDFKELRAKLRFAEVLAHYRVTLKMKGERATGFCPLPTHQGKRNSPSFSANIERGIWQCFGCRAKGNVLDFACRMEGFNPADSKELRQAAVKIHTALVGGAKPINPKQPPVPANAAPPKNVIINPPLDFELKGLDFKHPYLRSRGFTDETIRQFGLGYCNRGVLKGRIAIPLHDHQGGLVGYAGRIIDDGLINESCPKYLFPGTRERNGRRIEFRKSLLLFNAHRIQASVDRLIVVEGFATCWWLWQAGHRGTVALMGSACSSEQAGLIVRLTKSDGIVWLLPDGDDAGDRCAHSFLPLVATQRSVRWVRPAAGKQATDYSEAQLAALVSSQPR